MSRSPRSVFVWPRWLSRRIREWWVPAEFRFPPAPEIEGTESLAVLLGKIHDLLSLPRTDRDRAPEGEERLRRRFFGELATEVWRLRQKLVEPGTNRARESFRREYRHLESIWDLLEQAGVRIQDHTGAPFDPGQALKALDRIPTPGITRERVQSTIKPSVYLQGKHIQMGEVLVETPEPPAPNQASGTAGA